MFVDFELKYPIPEIVINEVCNYKNIELSEFFSDNQERTISLSRQIAIYLIKNNCKKHHQKNQTFIKRSYLEIAKIIGRSKSTVEKSYTTLKGLIQTNKQIREEVQEIELKCFQTIGLDSYEVYLRNKLNELNVELERYINEK